MKDKKVYVVTMYRFGDHERHSYVLGVWSKKEAALSNGEVEECFRGGKYKAEVTYWIVDNNGRVYPNMEEGEE